MSDSTLVRRYYQAWEKLRTSDSASHMSMGQQPALLVVDFTVGFGDLQGPLGFDLSSEIEATNVLLAVAGKAGVPVIFTTVAYEPDSAIADVWLEKIPGGRGLILGTQAVELDPRLDRQPCDRLLVKTHASCFFGTDLASDLKSKGVDTVIIVGATTSGCVRASAVDACSYGLRTMVVEDCAADRSRLQHIANLIDIHTKYGEVVGLATAAEYLFRDC